MANDPAAGFLRKPFVFPHTREALQVVNWSGQRVSTAVSAVSARVTLPTGSTLIEISSTENCYINFGDNTVTASSSIASDGSRLFIAGVQVIPVPVNPSTGVPYTHLAAIYVDAQGVLQAETVS